MTEKIKLSNSNIYNIITNGITSTGTSLILKINTDKALSDINTEFSNTNNVKDIVLQQEDGTELKVYKEYVICKSITADKENNCVVIVLNTENKIDKLEKQVSNLQDAFAEFVLGEE